MGFTDYCRREKKRLILTAAASLLMTLALILLPSDRGDVYLMDGDRVVGVRALKDSDNALLSLTAEKDGVSVSKEVVLGRKKAGSGSSPVRTLSEEEKLKYSVDSAVRDLSIPDDSELILPEELPDGTVLDWRRPRGGRTYLLPLLACPLLMLYGYRGEKDKAEKRAREEADGILRSLPEFNNKVVLLLGSGMVFDDVLSHIASEKTGEGDTGGTSIAGLLASAKREAEAVNGDMTAILSARASEMHIRELSRMVNLIYENRFTGADLAEKLSAEGEGLWAVRRKRAEEKGRRAETGLALPMSVTLLALVAVTAAPAMMQI